MVAVAATWQYLEQEVYKAVCELGACSFNGWQQNLFHGEQRAVRYKFVTGVVRIAASPAVLAHVNYEFN